MPMRPRTAHASPGSSRSNTRALPPCGRSSVASTRSSVVLPAPLGPKTTSVSPSWSVSVTPLSTRRSPWLRASSSSCSAGTLCRQALDERRARRLRAGDQLTHGPLAVRRLQQGDRVGISAHDLLEELLALLIGRERRLRPATRLVEQQREGRVGLAELL